MIRQLIILSLVSIKEFVREPGTIFWALLFPILMAGALGLAFSRSDVERVEIAVVAAPDSLAFQRLQRSISGPGEDGLEIALRAVQDEAAATLALRQGAVAFYLIPRAGGWSAKLDRASAGARVAWLAAERRLHRAAGQAQVLPSAQIERRGDRYIDFLAPGLVAMGVMNSCLWGVGFGLIDLRIRKLLRRMAASPMSRSAFLLAQMLSRSLFVAIETAALLAFTAFFFGQQMQGAWLNFVLLIVAGVLAFAGIAIFAAARAESLRAANGIVNAITLPMMVLSGIFFSYRNFPDWLVPILEKLPLSILADALRAVFNEGAGLSQVAPALFLLSLTGLVFFTLGLRLFRWR